MKNLSIFILLCITLASVRAQYETNIFFQTYAPDGTIFNSTFDNNSTLLAECDVNGNITIIIHGWKESVKTEWTSALIGNFLAARGGCVMFMDYK